MNDVGRIDTKTQRLKAFIDSMGEYGASVREMQRALWYMSHDGVRMERRSRHGLWAGVTSDYGEAMRDCMATGFLLQDVPPGYWSTSLYGERGFLARHCQKNSHGRWTLKQTAH